MTRLEDRQRMVRCIEQAMADGARAAKACEAAGITVRTLRRWQADGTGDGRADAQRPLPSHALTSDEKAAMLQVANEPRFAEMPPARIVPMLADEGRYLASESSFHRVLKANGQLKHRGRAKAPAPRKAPTTHVATAPGQVWCWDITWLPTPVLGRWFYLYLIMDLYSRKIVGYEVHAVESDDHAALLLKKTALAEGVHGMDTKPILHGDNGAVLKATTVLSMLHWLGIPPSYSRPRVSNDNAFVESLFRTAKYHPSFPTGGFATLTDARQWALKLVSWYNNDHRHSGIRYVTPSQRHARQDRALLAGRAAVYMDARRRNPRRWSGNTRNWTPIGHVTLNPERDSLAAVAADTRISAKAA